MSNFRLAEKVFGNITIESDHWNYINYENSRILNIEPIDVSLYIQKAKLIKRKNDISIIQQIQLQRFSMLQRIDTMDKSTSQSNSLSFK